MARVRETLDQLDVMLQSASEAVVVRIVKNGADYSHEPQLTRTAAIYFLADGKWHVAFDDIADPGQNVLYVGIAEYVQIPWEFSPQTTDEYVRTALHRSEKNDRIVALPDGFDLLHVVPADGKSEFGSNPVVKAILGEIAEPYAQWLHDDNRSWGVVNLLHKSQLEEYVGTAVTIKPLVLGGGFFLSDKGRLYANKGLFDADGLIRAVRPRVDTIDP